MCLAVAIVTVKRAPLRRDAVVLTTLAILQLILAIESDMTVPIAALLVMLVTLVLLAIVVVDVLAEG
jgi:hypothetical protein